jgi:hypothetical protein
MYVSTSLYMWLKRTGKKIPRYQKIYVDIVVKNKYILKYFNVSNNQIYIYKLEFDLEWLRKDVILASKF